MYLEKTNISADEPLYQKIVIDNNGIDHPHEYEYSGGDLRSLYDGDYTGDLTQIGKL